MEKKYWSSASITGKIHDAEKIAQYFMTNYSEEKDTVKPIIVFNKPTYLNVVARIYQDYEKLPEFVVVVFMFIDGDNAHLDFTVLVPFTAEGIVPLEQFLWPISEFIEEFADSIEWYEISITTEDESRVSKKSREFMESLKKKGE